MKKPIGLVVDSGTDLPKGVLEENDIEVVSQLMDWPEIEKYPGDNIFQKMREAEKDGISTFVKTSQPPVNAFVQGFKKQLEKYEKVICITVTSKHSGTYNSAFQAKRFLEEEGENISVIDSLSVTGSMALLVLKILEMIKQGKTDKEIAEEAQSLKSQSHLCLFLEDPKWLEASGRITPLVSGWISKMQKMGIRPMLGMKQGQLKPIGLKMGVKDVPTAMFKELESKAKGKKVKAVITHADNADRASRLKEMIENNLENAEVVFVNMVNDILGSLAGPDALVLCWIED